MVLVDDRDESPPPGRDRRVRLLVLAAAGLLVVAVLVALAVAAFDRRRHTLEAAQDTARNLARIIEEQTTGSLAAVDGVLRATAATVQLLPSRAEPRDRFVHRLLRENAQALPFLRAIWILDADGEMIHDSDDLPGRYNLSDRAYFQAHRDRAGLGLFVDRIIRSRLGVWFLGVSHRLENPDGSFAGVVVAAIEPKYLQGLFGSIDVGRHGVVGLLEIDGTVVARVPSVDALIGQKISPPPSFVGAPPHLPAGDYKNVSGIDGVTRLYSYRRVAAGPLVVVVGLGEREVLAGWRGLSAVYGAASLALVLVIGWLGFLMLRELQKRSALAAALTRDVAARKRAESLLDAQRRVLELVAIGNPLPRTLTQLVRAVEEQAPDMVASILLLDPDGIHLRHGAAPGLPPALVGAIDGEAIGERAGSCGTAAFRREPVIVEDIASDPLWQNYPGLVALAHASDLRACWSTPIFNARHEVLGTFALYYRAERRPDQRHRAIIEMATHVAAIAITRAREEETLHELVDRMRELSRRLIEVEEATRRSLNRELHDRIGQNLSTLKLNLDLARGQWPRDAPAVAAGRLDEAQKLLVATIADVRNVMAELHPPALDDFGLLAALRIYADSFGARAGTTISVHGDEVAPRLKPAVEMGLFRIAQEALANAAKHAGAASIDVVLTVDAHGVALTIADDGRGFDSGVRKASSASWGLTIMRERAEAVGAKLRIDSSPGRGTRVLVEAPREAACR